MARLSVRKRWTKRQPLVGGRRTGTGRVLFALRLLRIIVSCSVEYVISIYLFIFLLGLSCPCLSLSLIRTSAEVNARPRKR